MPVDKATLDRYIGDVAGEDQELATMLRERLGTKDEAATRFVGGFMRNQDYTQKTQTLAQQQKQYEAAQNDYEARLTQADAEKDQIMRDLAQERISASKATSLLKTVQQAYGLTANDLPGLDDIKETARSGRVVDSTPDLDERLVKFEQKIMDKVTQQLIPEISGLAILGPVWNDIGYEHEKLFGKRLTKKEQADILGEARKQNTSLESVWQNKYGVSDRRLEVRDEENKNKWRQEWNDEQSKRNQELALNGVRPESNEFAFEERQSPIFKRRFEPTADEAKVSQYPTERVAEAAAAGSAAKSDAGRERTGGAERAAAKFMERARNGNLGKPIADQRKAS